MRSPAIAIIERLNAGSPSVVVPVYGETGRIGDAVWEPARGAHCLRMPLADYQRHRRFIVAALGRGEGLAVDFDGGEPAPTELEIILVDYQLDNETAESCLLRLLSYQSAMRSWTPQKGKRPVLELPAPCSPRAS